MILQLAATAGIADILGTWWGLALFVAADVAVLILIMALNYRWFFKRALDVLFASVFLLAFSPFFLVFLLAQWLYNRSSNAYPTLFVSEIYSGKKRGTVKVTYFATERILHDEAGSLLPVRERETPFGKFLKGCGMKYYPALLSVLTGGLSFVGPKPMSPSDAAAVSEEGAARFAVRPGLVSSLELYGGEALTYPDMFEEDAEYAARVNLFRDIAFFMAKIANAVRGENGRFGVCTRMGYVEWLKETGEITEEEAALYAEEGRKEEQRKREERERRNYEKEMFNRFQ